MGLLLFLGVLLLSDSTISWDVRALGNLSVDVGEKNTTPFNLYAGFKATHIE